MKKRGPKGPRQTVDLRDFDLWLQVNSVRVALGCSVYRAIKAICEAKGPLEIPYEYQGMPAVLRIGTPATLQGRKRPQSREPVRTVYRRMQKRFAKVGGCRP